VNTNKNFETLKVTNEGGVLRIVINRPEALNALNLTVLAEIEQALFTVMKAEKTRVIIFEGSGEKAFVAGADIAGMADMDSEAALVFAQKGQMLTKALETLPQISIAKVQGFALGGGCELAMACDLVIAGRSARFGQPEVNLGIIPGFGGTQRLARRVGLPVALDMVCSGRGRMLSGDEAFSLGLVSRVVDDDKLDAELESAVKSILKAGPRAVAEAKRLTRESYAMTMEAGLNSEAAAFGNCFARPEAREGIRAFVEKRSPKF
jgi:enoyl-CoA hydratase